MQEVAISQVGLVISTFLCLRNAHEARAYWTNEDLSSAGPTDHFGKAPPKFVPGWEDGEMIGAMAADRRANRICTPKLSAG